MVYFAASPYEHIVRVTKASSNEKAVRYAFAWSTEDTAFGGYNYNVTATPTDLGYSDSTFSYTTLRLYDNNELANNKTLYVQIRKHNNSGIVFTSQLYSVNFNSFSTGELTQVAYSAANFNKDEYIEVLVYFDSSKRLLASLQYIRPVFF